LEKSLTWGGRARRLIATALATGALFVGTFWGDDDNWPFGPFRMYSVRNRLDGRIRAALVELTMADGSEVREKISPDAIALKRAEVEGQIERVDRNPSLLRHLAGTYGELHPDAPAVVGIRLYYEMTRMKAGRPDGPVTEYTVATWQRT
jgi:hypothetical protein